MNLGRGLSALNVLFHEKHATLESLFFPLLSVKMVQTYMTELIQDGDYGGIATFEHSDVIVIYLVDGSCELFLKLW